MEKKCDLNSCFGRLAAAIPPCNADRCLVISKDVLPAPPGTLESNQLVVIKGEHHYGSFRIDSLWFQATPDTYRNLGLLILSTVFHPEPSAVFLELTHPDSMIRTIVVESVYPTIEENGVGYHTLPFIYYYWPEDAAWHPFKDEDYDCRELPCLHLTNRNDCMITEEDWRTRDTVRVRGTDIGQVLFSELLLNVACSDPINKEFCLEGELGVRGVAPGSAEVVLHLPGSLGWEPQFWE